MDGSGWAMAKVTLKRIAEKVGFSEATVSRVLSGHGNVYKIRPETEKAIFETARRMGYTRGHSVFKPKLLRTRTLGLVIPDLSHFFLGRLARTIVSRAAASGLSVLVCDTLEDTEAEVQRIEQLLEQDIDGLLVLPVGREWDHIARLSHRGLPVVVVDRIVPDVGCHCVGVDNYNGSFEATEHLIESGYRRIGCIQRLPHSWINDERIRGYRDAHAKHGIPVDDRLIVGDLYGQQNGYLEAKRLLQMDPRPDAIFAMSHLVTLGALRALREHEIAVPGQMGLLGFDDMPNAEYFDCPITTVRQPIEEMADLAVTLLIEQLESQRSVEPVTIKLPTELVRRRSV
ncbi:MAG TPA: LacI family DNA-binding transcriptional regulator [Sedimentisphaerales bacterium]|nr:LacI family DNA-binding transcriptional regulator [Sedimentisphaerales bacterium]